MRIHHTQLGITSSSLHSFQGDRFVGAMSVIKARAPVTGGNFGVWGGMFSTFDCAVKGWRQKEDMWNAIISGFLTGGCLAARSELATALSSLLIMRPLPIFAIINIEMFQVARGLPLDQLLLVVFC